MANIGKNIKKARMTKNMKQEDLASKLYVTRSAISNYETNRSNPDIETLQQIAEALDTDVNTLIYGEQKQQINRKPLYIMMIILAVALILLGPVSYLIETVSKNIQANELRTPILYIIWGINIKSILMIMIVAIVVYLFLYTLRVKLPYKKLRRVISCLMIIGCILYAINTFLFWKQRMTWSLWFQMYKISEIFSTCVDIVYGIVFGLCSYQTLFFQNTYGEGEEKIHEWLKRKKWIILGSAVAFVLALVIINQVTMKETVVYGSVTTKSPNHLDFEVDDEKTDRDGLERIYDADSYSLDMSAIENIDEVSDSLEKGVGVKLVIRDYLFELEGKKWYIYVDE